MIVEKTSRMITYKLDKYEAVDKTAFEMLHKGAVPGFFILGRDGADIKIPVADCTPLLEYLGYNPGLETIKEIIKQEVSAVSTMDRYFLDGSAPVLKIDFAYVYDNRLRLICLPAAHANAVPDCERDFLRAIVAAGRYEDGEQNKVCELLRVINEGDFSTEKLFMKLEEIVPPAPFAEEKSEECEENIKKKKEKRSIGERIRSFFIVDEKAYLYGNNEEYESRTDQTDFSEKEELPQGINVIVVRETGAEYPLCFGPDYIGRDENSCSICFPNDESLGGKHCSVRFMRGRYVIEDLGCPGGTKLNGNLITPHKPRALSSADLITVGAHALVFSHRP